MLEISKCCKPRAPRARWKTLTSTQVVVGNSSLLSCSGLIGKIIWQHKEQIFLFLISEDSSCTNAPESLLGKKFPFPHHQSLSVPNPHSQSLFIFAPGQKCSKVVSFCDIFLNGPCAFYVVSIMCQMWSFVYNTAFMLGQQRSF